MLGKRFSFNVQKKDYFYWNFQFKMTKRNIFYKIIATTTKKVEVYWLKLINIPYFGSILWYFSKKKLV